MEVKKQMELEDMRPCAGWVVESGGITLCQAGKGAICSIPYPFAVVWDCMVRRHRTERCIRMFAAVSGTDEDSARRQVVACLEDWQTKGLVREAGDV
ncbi:MAG: hypothetical protein C0404_05325 [Verrucomicrobia bacterium]|nr:hypothetical protein [Verrucomicrobiota bacterium]